MPIVVSDGDTVHIKITGTADGVPKSDTIVADKNVHKSQWEAIVLGHKVGDSVTLPAPECNVVYGEIIEIEKAA